MGTLIPPGYTGGGGAGIPGIGKPTPGGNWDPCCGGNCGGRGNE